MRIMKTAQNMRETAAKAPNGIGVPAVFLFHNLPEIVAEELNEGVVSSQCPIHVSGLKEASQ